MIAGDKVVTYGADGWLHAFELDSGKKLWGRNVVSGYKVPPSFFGVGSSPMVVGDRVLVNVGAKNAGIVAFALDSGQEQRATDDGGQLFFPDHGDDRRRDACGVLHAPGACAARPEDRDVRFQTRWRPRIEASVNAATPLIVSDSAFFSTSYDTGALLLKLKKDGAEKLWDTDELMTNHYNTSVHKDGHLYHGRQEAGASFRCVELKSQSVLGSAAIRLRVDDSCGRQDHHPDRARRAAPGRSDAGGVPRAGEGPGVRLGPVPCADRLANGRMYARDQEEAELL